MTTTKSRLIPAGGLIFGLALLVAAPLIGWELRPTILTPQNSRQATSPAQPQGQPPPTGTAPQRAGEPPRSGGPGRPGPLWERQWWTEPEVQKALALTEPQVKNISRIFENRVKRAQPLAEKYEKERAELDRLTAERKVSVEEYALQVMQVEALRSELNKGRHIMLYQIYRELTPEQYQKLVEIRNKWMSGGRGRGSGSHH